MNALVIAWNDLVRLFREKRALFWIFIGPLMFTLFFGLLMRPRGDTQARVDLLNLDSRPTIAVNLAAALERDGLIVQRVDRTNPNRLTLVVPSGATDLYDANKPVKVVLKAASDESNLERTVRFKVQKALVAMYLAVPGTAGEIGTIPAEPLVLVDKDLGVKRREITTGFQRSVPSYLVMFVFLNLLVSGAGIAEERASGKLKRLTIAPVSRRDILVGKLLGRFATGWIQIGYMLILGLLFQIRWGEHLAIFFLFLTIYALAAASLGILFGTLFKDPDKCSSLAVWTAILLSPLGGLWWPLEIVGPTMRRIAYFTPTGWAMEGVNSMLAFGAGAAEVAPFALALAAMFAVTFSLAVRRLKA